MVSNADSNKEERSRYKSVLKSTSLIGGASITNILIGMIRTKFVAILLGPAGVGLLGIFVNITNIFRTLSGLGLSMSGVRSIAEKYGQDKPIEVAQIVQTLRRTVWITGLLGTGLVMICSPFVSYWTFGNYSYTISIALLGLTILFGNIAIGQTCVIRGTRRIGDLAKLQILGALNSTIIAIPFYYYFGMRGIVPSLVCTSIVTLATSWFFARRVQIVPCVVPLNKLFDIACKLLFFGLPFMLTVFVGILVEYLIKWALLHHFDLQSIGIYTAAYSLSGILVNFVLEAMAADYYPRLTAVANDPDKIEAEVASQAEVALLLATPLLMATIIFAPFIIRLFYTSEFEYAIYILRWMVFGLFGRILSWPLSYIILAKGMGKTYFICDSFSYLFHFCAILFCSATWGLIGTGVAFVLYYTFSTILMLFIYYLLTKHTWRLSYCLQMSFFLLLLIVVVLLTVFVNVMWLDLTLNLLILSITGLLCYWRLSKKTGIGIKELKQRFFRKDA